MHRTSLPTRWLALPLGLLTVFAVLGSTASLASSPGRQGSDYCGDILPHVIEAEAEQAKDLPGMRWRFGWRR